MENSGCRSFYFLLENVTLLPKDGHLNRNCSRRACRTVNYCLQFRCKSLLVADGTGSAASVTATTATSSLAAPSTAV